MSPPALKWVGLAAACLALAAAIAACDTTTQPPPLTGKYDGGHIGTSPDGAGGDDGATGGTGDDTGSVTTPDGSSPLPDVVPSDVYLSPGNDGAEVAPMCDPNTKWGAPVNVPGVPMFPSQPIVTMTSDGLTVAWVTDAGSGMGSVFVADRTADTAAFGAASAVTPFVGPAGNEGGYQYFSFDRVALSGDGLTLVGVPAGGGQMADFTRPDKASVFIGPLPSRYQAVVQSLMQGEQLGDPVLSSDGDDLIYSRYRVSETVSVYEAFTSGKSPWPAGGPQSGPSLAVSDAGKHKKPTALSEDRLTLFVWDEATNTVEAMFRSSPNAAFGVGQPFGSFYSVQVSHACKRLYFVAQSGSNYVLQQEDVQ
jgi:hypothetical protein